MVEYMHRHSVVKGSSSTAAAGIKKKVLHIKMTSTCSAVVVHLPHHPNVKGSSSATAVGTSRGSAADTYGAVVVHLPHHPSWFEFYH